MSVYQSLNYKTTHFNLSNIKTLISNTFPNSMQSFELNSLLSSTKLYPVKLLLTSSSYFFDKMSCQNKDIESIRYLYIASVDSNLSFIDSIDTEASINNSNLSNYFISQVEDSNNSYSIYSVEGIKYHLFEYNFSEYIGILVPVGDSCSIIIVVETFNDDSRPIESSDLTSIDINYGFDVLEENEIFLTSVQNPYDNFFEYAS